MKSENHISLDETFKRLNNRNVKDLYWLLFSRCPINNKHPDLSEIPFFPTEIVEEWKQNTVDYFLNLDKEAAVLTHFLKRPKNSRLGFYAEALLSFFFQTYSEVELILQNYQIIESKRTLGEVDFIFKWKKRVIHIECAVKFYLLDESKEVCDLHSWIGPACKDDLGRKMKKVKDHQLPMIQAKEFKDAFSLDKVESYLFLKGKLFASDEVQCDWLDSDLLGRYGRLDDLTTIHNLRLLVKPYWMSAQWEENESIYSKEFEKINLKKRAEFVLKKGMKPMFVIPKNWPF